MMADSKPFNTEDWLGAQKKYWDAWMDMSRKAMGNSAAQTSWADAVETWWKAASVNVPDASRPYVEPMMQMGRNFYSISEKLFQSGSTGEDMSGNVQKWLDNMQEAFRSMAGGQMPGQDLNAFWKMPMDTWNRVASSFMPLPGDFMQALRPSIQPPYGEAAKEHMDRFLSVPGVGYTRESQEQYQTLGKLMLDYQQAAQRYQAAFAQVGLQTIERFKARLEEASQQNKPITSAREFYDQWVDVSEEVYGEFVMSDDYSRVYGDMVNSLMRVKMQGTRLMDEASESLNMPTRREVNTLHQRLQESRREIQKLKGLIRDLAQQQAALMNRHAAADVAASARPEAEPAATQAATAAPAAPKTADTPRAPRKPAAKR